MMLVDESIDHLAAVRTELSRRGLDPDLDMKLWNLAKKNNPILGLVACDIAQGRAFRRQ